MKPSNENYGQEIAPEMREAITRERIRTVILNRVVVVGVAFLIGYGCGIWACHTDDVGAWLSRIIYHVKPL